MTSSNSPKSQSSAPLPPRQNLPTMYDLPSEDPAEPGWTEFDFLQSWLLCETFSPTTKPPGQVFSAGDLYLYYDLDHLQWHKRPGWFGVVGTPRLYEGHDLRYSYVTWIEPANPVIVVELLSMSTKKKDLGEIEKESREIESGPDKPPTKWEVYEKILKIPYFVVFGCRTNEIRMFHLVDEHYEEIQPNEGRLFIPELGISLGCWQGSFQGRNRLWLRWFRSDVKLIPTPEEEAALAKQEAALAKQETALAKQETALVKRQAALAKKRTDKLMEKLRQLGIDPDEIE